MEKPKAYGTFTKKGDHIFRTSAYIQWGTSAKSLGACLLLNPGSATLDDDLTSTLKKNGSASGWVKTEDPTMEQLILLTEEIHGKSKTISGRLHIYNLFNLQNTQSTNAIDEFESLVNSGKYDMGESLVTSAELMYHPWLFLGWGVKQEGNWKNLQLIKGKWLKVIKDSGIPTFGKKHKQRNDYYHPCPRIPTQRPLVLEELVALFKQKIALQRFTQHATKPNVLVKSEYVENTDPLNLLKEGLFRYWENPETIVKGFSHIRIKDEYKLRAYQYRNFHSGYGVVWAIPVDKDLPAPEDCESPQDFFNRGPKPSFALNDFMEAIEGDKTPMSYLQASVVYHELHEFGAIWHSISWGQDVILPSSEIDILNINELEFVEDEPEIIEPHFYYNSEENPVIVFHTHNNLEVGSLNRYVHIFNKDNYTVEVEKTCIATGGGGLIF